MKWLKYFESNSIKPIDYITDVFQDVIDEYGFIVYDSEMALNGVPDNEYVYKFKDLGNAADLEFYTPLATKSIDSDMHKMDESFFFVSKEILKSAKRLESMGFKVKTSVDNDLKIVSVNISDILSESKSDSFMKYLKYFESNSISLDMQTILDIFQDVIDDHGMEHSDFNYELGPGLYYNLTDDKLVGGRFWLWIWRSNHHQKITDMSPEEIKIILPYIKSDLERLNRLGYTTDIFDNHLRDFGGYAHFKISITDNKIEESIDWKRDKEDSQTVIDIFQDVIDDYGFIEWDSEEHGVPDNEYVYRFTKGLN